MLLLLLFSSNQLKSIEISALLYIIWWGKKQKHLLEFLLFAPPVRMLWQIKHSRDVTEKRQNAKCNWGCYEFVLARYFSYGFYLHNSTAIHFFSFFFVLERPTSLFDQTITTIFVVTSEYWVSLAINFNIPKLIFCFCCCCCLCAQFVVVVKHKWIKKISPKFDWERWRSAKKHVIVMIIFFAIFTVATAATAIFDWAYHALPYIYSWNFLLYLLSL